MVNNEARWTVLEGSLVGPYHRKNGEEGQDFGGFLLTPDGSAVVAVADGAGSHEHSLAGATLLVTRVLEQVEAHGREHGGPISENLLEEVALQAREELLAHEHARAMGATLAIAAAGPWGWSAWVVGDAFALISFGVEHHLMVQPVKTAEFANFTELMSSPIITPLKVSGPEAPLSISASSDGLLGSMTSRGLPAGSVWATLMKKALGGTLDLQKFFRFLEVKKRIEDDTTLVMAVREDEAFLEEASTEVLVASAAPLPQVVEIPEASSEVASEEVASPREEEENEGPFSPSHEHLISGGTPGEQGKSLSEEEDAGAPVVLEPVADTSLKEAPSLDSLLESEGLGGEPVDEVPSSVPVLGDDPLTELYFSGGTLKEASFKK